VRFLDDPNVDLSAYDLESFGEQAQIDVDDNSLRIQEDAEYGRAAPLRPVTMRLDGTLIRALKRIGRRRGISYQTLARMWLRERAIEEFRAEAGRPRRRVVPSRSRGRARTPGP
jgi:predicted DNA binding CopG/RHH family protein